MHGILSKAFVVGVLAIAAAAMTTLAAPPREPGHTPFHVGCKHHDHGPKWHADHGRILGVKRSQDSDDADGAPGTARLTSRSLAAGRPIGARPDPLD